jgi:hypothetical protein
MNKDFGDVLYGDIRASEADAQITIRLIMTAHSPELHLEAWYPLISYDIILYFRLIYMSLNMYI